MVEGVATEPCWCTKLPVLPAGALPSSGEGPVAATCFCPDCLRAHVSAVQAEHR